MTGPSSTSSSSSPRRRPATACAAVLPPAVRRRYCHLVMRHCPPMRTCVPAAARCCLTPVACVAAASRTAAWLVAGAAPRPPTWGAAGAATRPTRSWTATAYESSASSVEENASWAAAAGKRRKKTSRTAGRPSQAPESWRCAGAPSACQAGRRSQPATLGRGLRATRQPVDLVSSRVRGCAQANSCRARQINIKVLVIHLRHTRHSRLHTELAPTLM